MEERLFSYLYFKNKELNGKAVAGKFETLKVRFLYSAVEQIPLGRVHLYEYSPKKFTRTLCLKNGFNNKEAEKHECPMCDVAMFGTPANKYYAFVSDLEDNGALKLLEFNYSLGKQIDEIAEIKGRPVHDLVFILSKKGTGKETTYVAMLDETSTFNVTEYFGLLGISDYPKIVGSVDDKAPILQLSREAMEDFINGKYPWSANGTTNGTGSSRKFTSLGTTVTVRNEHTKVDVAGDAVTDINEDAEIEIVDDAPSSESFF